MPSERTAIGWTDATWSPTVGCTRVSPGCDNCYAFALHDARHATNRAVRRAGDDVPWPAQYDLPFSTVQLFPKRLDWPLHWRGAKEAREADPPRPSRIFVDSMADLFHEDVPDEFIDRVFATMAICGAQRQRCKARARCTHEDEPGCWRTGNADDEPRHIFQVLTKRPERMLAYLSAPDRRERVLEVGNDPEWSVAWEEPYELIASVGWPLSNVWLGVSVEDQPRADERIPLLLETPAAVHFVSAEPLLGPVDLAPWLVAPGPVTVTACSIDVDNPATAAAIADLAAAAARKMGWTTLDWVIVGGESGPRFRPLEMAWVRSLREQCRAAGVAYFGKQTAARRNEVPLPDDDAGEGLGLGDQEFPCARVAGVSSSRVH